MSEATPQSYEFQAEIQQLLHIVIHSLYTEKEIFVRELVSNASDALEKLRHQQLTEKSVFDDKLPLEINLSTDDTAGTFTIQDFGVGMTREELVQNLGTIAHSGSKALLQQLGEGSRKDMNLIGQFGVGFYSAFMVAKSVRVYTRSWQPEGQGWLWQSDGSGRFSIEPAEGVRRGTKIVIDLRDDAKEFARASRVQDLVRRYSNFLQFPIQVNGERANTVQAIWLRAKSEIKEEEYTEFYKFIGPAWDEPLYRLHFSADAPLAINALLFVPKENPERWGLGRTDPRVHLYCRRVLIDAQPKDLLPEWLRFLRGVVDSEDLPLNISRELTQDRALLEKVGRILTKRFLKFLEEEAKERPEAYAAFHQQFALFLKEGVANDPIHREQLGRLLRFETSVLEAGRLASLVDYVGRMKGEQKEIYYLVGPSRAALEAGPYLEGLKARGLEVLLCTEKIDEFVLSHLREFEGKRLVAADNGELDLGEAPPAEGEALPQAEADALCSWMKEQLGERVASVSASRRLVGNPALVLDADKRTSVHLRHLMRALKTEGPDDALRVTLEINPRHALVHRLAALRNAQPELAKLVAEQVLDNSLAAAGLLEDPAAMVARSYRLLERLGS